MMKFIIICLYVNEGGKNERALRARDRRVKRERRGEKGESKRNSHDTKQYNEIHSRQCMLLSIEKKQTTQQRK